MSPSLFAQCELQRLIFAFYFIAWSTIRCSVLFFLSLSIDCVLLLCLNVVLLPLSWFACRYIKRGDTNGRQRTLNLLIFAVDSVQYVFGGYATRHRKIPTFRPKIIPVNLLTVFRQEYHVVNAILTEYSGKSFLIFLLRIVHAMLSLLRRVCYLKFMLICQWAFFARSLAISHSYQMAFTHTHSHISYDERIASKYNNTVSNLSNNF